MHDDVKRLDDKLTNYLIKVNTIEYNSEKIKKNQEKILSELELVNSGLSALVSLLEKRSDDK